MPEIITQTDLDNLADIIWWIKGCIAGARDNYESCPFDPRHVESIRKVRANEQVKISRDRKGAG